VTVIVIAFDGGFFDRPVHALDVAVGPRMEFAGAINGDIEVEFAISGLELCDVDMKIADGIALELFLK
jgi:hypothetical protein